MRDCTAPRGSGANLFTPALNPVNYSSASGLEFRGPQVQEWVLILLLALKSDNKELHRETL